MYRKILTHKNLLIIIILTSLTLRLFRLDYPQTYVFDEVYHAFTAREYLKGSLRLGNGGLNHPKELHLNGLILLWLKK